MPPLKKFFQGLRPEKNEVPIYKTKKNPYKTEKKDQKEPPKKPEKKDRLKTEKDAI